MKAAPCEFRLPRSGLYSKLARGGRVMRGYRVPIPINEPVRSYAPETAERQALKQKIGAMSAEKIEIPLVIGGKEVRTGGTGTQGMAPRPPHLLGHWHKAASRAMEHKIKGGTGRR